MSEQIHDNPHSRPVSKGTLRRLYRRWLKRPELFGSVFRRADSFKVWVKLNIRPLLAYYHNPHDRHKAGAKGGRAGFTTEAATLLEV